MINHSQNHIAKSVLCLSLGALLWSACSEQSGEVDRSPEAEAESFRFEDPDLRITLVAAEPDITSPADMAWGPDGALYVAEIPGYPIDSDLGSIKKLTDPDGDGRYHMESVFRDDLNFPTSIKYYNGGLLVIDAPDLLYLADTNGDGEADMKEVILTGFDQGNEQYRANALHWGLDNWLYASGGRGGGSIRFHDDTTEVSIEGRDFRFDPIERKFEAITGMSQFGLARNNWGDRFITLNHRFARQVMLEKRHLERNPYLATEAVFDTYQDEHDRRVYTLLSEAQRFNRDPIGYFTSLSGLTTNRGHLMGPEYNGDLFAGESVQAAVIHRKMKQEGATYAAMALNQGTEFLASPDGWFHPVNFSNGPDGAFYMVDFYRNLVEHPEWAYDELSDGIDWREGHEYGRIWRIAHKDHEPDASLMRLDLENASVDQLVEYLSDPAGWRRDMAQQLLVLGKKKEAGPALETLLKSENPVVRSHALWTMNGLDLLSEDHITMALEDSVDQVQVQAIRLAEARLADSPILSQRVAELTGSPEELVRYHAILTSGQVDDGITREALNWTATQYDDTWSRVALLSSTSSWADEFTRKLLHHQKVIESTDVDYSFYGQLGTMVAGVSQTGSWINALTEGQSELHLSEIAFLLGYLEASNSLGNDLPRFSQRFFRQVTQLIKSPPDSESAKLGVKLLGYSNSKEVHDQLIQLIQGDGSNEVKMVAIGAVAALDDMELMNQLFGQLSALDPLVRKELISSSLSSNASVASLLLALEEEKVKSTEIPEELRYALLSHSNEDLKNQATELIGKSVDPNRQAVVEQYLASIGNQTVDLNNGASVFSTHCSSCHAINGQGGLLAPDLTNIGSRTDDVLLIAILDPSRMVSYELKLHVVITNGGEVFSGTLSAETISSITIRQPNGQENTILRDNIKEHTTTDQSIMPEGFERMINEQEMADLIGFLRQPVEVGD